MRALRSVLVLALSFAGAAAAADFDGAVPLTCRVEKAHDCLPTQSTCSPLKPETDIDPVYGIDFAKKEVRSPFRTAVMSIVHTARVSASQYQSCPCVLVDWFGSSRSYGF